jgi:hypothetical protein
LKKLFLKLQEQDASTGLLGSVFEEAANLLKSGQGNDRD